jgi:hypothetical protein
MAPAMARSSVVSVALAVALATFALSTPAFADEPERPTFVDSGVYPPSGTQLPLFFVALGATAGWYGAALGFSYLFPDAPGAKDLRIPVAGPWMALADTGCRSDDPDCSKFIVVLRAILTTMDAIGQTGGVAVMGEALFLSTQDPAPTRPRRRPRLRRESRVRITPAPVLSGKDGVGFGVVGQF